MVFDKMVITLTFHFNFQSRANGMCHGVLVQNIHMNLCVLERDEQQNVLKNSAQCGWVIT